MRLENIQIKKNFFGGIKMKFFKSLKRSALTTAILSTLLFGNTVSAEQTGMEAFQEAMTKSPAHDSRIFREQLIFFLPDAKANLDFQGVAQNDTDLRIRGTLNFVITDMKGDTSPMDIPFYIDQTKKKLTLYFKFGDEWKKFKAPKITASAVDVLGTPTEEDFKEWMSSVKSAEVLRETENQRTMLLDLDEAALSKIISTEYEAEKDEPMTEEDRAFQESFMKYFNQGLQKTDVWCTWTVDKKDWQTITLAINFSGLVQETAKAALNDPDANFNQPLIEFLESLAYYSELKSYTTYLNPDLKTKIDLPKEVKAAKEVEDIIPNEPPEGAES